MKTLITATIAAALLCATTPSAEAKASSRSNSGTHASGKVIGVSPSKIMVMEGRRTVSYAVTESTTVTVNKKASKITAVRQGMTVSIIEKNGVAATVFASSPKHRSKHRSKHRGKRR